MTVKLLVLGRIACIFLSFGLCTAARAADNWVEVRSPHFTVASNASEKEARKIADQFEQVRSMFHAAFATFRVDPPQPILILAAKNENTMKQLLPEEYEVKGHIHHAGMYQPGYEKDYVIMRLDAEGENPSHTLYHEYTHALLRLNYNRLPLWLDEGLAEFFGNSTLGEKESKTGTIDPGHLYILGQNKFLPIGALLEVERNSPHYNESNRASVFYAESWALVHYLLMDPEARQKQLLKNFLGAWDKSGNQVAAAEEAFGDLKRFGQRIEGYARQSSFMIGIVKVTEVAAAKSYSARGLSPAEVLALRADFFTHHNRVEEAKPVLEEALKLEPNLAFAHEALGYYHYHRQEFEDADKEMQEALRLGSTNFLPLYFHGELLLRGSAAITESAAQEARSNLEKAIQANPQFAPAYDRLAQAYSRIPDMQKQAVNAAIRAVELERGTISYAFNLTYLLLNSNRDAEARTIAERILAAAGSAQERQMASDLLQRVRQHQEWMASRQAAGQGAPAADAAGPIVVTAGEKPEGGTSGDSARVPVQLARRLLAVDGPIGSVDCSNKPEIIVTLDLTQGPMSFHAANFANVLVSFPDNIPAPSLDNCAQWKGRKVKVSCFVTPGKEHAGEMTKLYFY